MTFTKNGKPWFLYSGEIHYWRIDERDWSDRLAAARAAGLNTVSTYVPWRLHEPAEGAIDLGLLERYIAAVGKSGLALFLRVGPIANAELVDEGLPSWLASDPATRPLPPPNSPLSSWCGFSYMAPRYLSATAKWYEAVLPVAAAAQSDRGGPIVAVQLCNEIGMIHWICKLADRAPHVMKMYRDFLRDLYDDDIYALEEAHNVRVGSFDRLEQPLNFTTGTNLLPHLDRARFFRHYFAKYYQTLAEQARAKGITVPLVANIPMFWDYDVRGRGLQAPMTVSMFSRFAELTPGVSLGGAYQMRRLDHENAHDIAVATEMVRMAVNAGAGAPGEPLCVELQTGILCDRPKVYPTDVDLNIRLSAGHGLSGVNGYMFCGGRNRPGDGVFGTSHEWQAPVAADGSRRPHFAPIASFGRFLAGMGDRVAATAKRPVTACGFYAPYWMTEYIEGPEAATMQSQRENTAFDGVWRLLDLTARPYRMIDLENSSLADVPSLFVFSLDRMDRPVQEKLAKYVRDGGTLVLWPALPRRDFRGQPCRVLAEALGLRTEPKPHQHLIIDREERYITSPIESVAAESADNVLAACADGSAAALLRHVGAGRVLFAGFNLEDRFLYWREIFSYWCDLLGIREQVCIRPLAELGAHLRFGDRGSFLTLANAQEVEIKAEVRAGGVRWKGLVVPPRGAWVLPVNVPLGAGVTLVQANAEVTRAVVSGRKVRIDFRAPALGKRFEAVFRLPGGKQVTAKAEAASGKAELALGGRR